MLMTYEHVGTRYTDTGTWTAAQADPYEGPGTLMRGHRAFVHAATSFLPAARPPTRQPVTTTAYTRCLGRLAERQGLA